MRAKPTPRGQRIVPPLCDVFTTILPKCLQLKLADYTAVLLHRPRHLASQPWKYMQSRTVLSIRRDLRAGFCSIDLQVLCRRALQEHGAAVDFTTHKKMVLCHQASIAKASLLRLSLHSHLDQHALCPVGIQVLPTVSHSNSAHCVQLARLN